MFGRKRKLEVDENTSFVYIRCGLPDEWMEIWRESGGGLSRATKNRLHAEQWNACRLHASRRDLEAKRVFFDCEEDPYDGPTRLTLPERQSLAAVFVAATDLKCGTVIVDHRHRLDEDECVQALLANTFRKGGIRLLEATTGLELSKALPLRAIRKAVPKEQWESAKRLVAKWKALIRPTGRKPFGAKQDEVLALERIRQLYHILPRNQQKKMGNKVLERRSFREIANQLNAEKVRSRTGRPWSARTVHGILDRLNLIPKRKPNS